MRLRLKHWHDAEPEKPLTHLGRSVTLPVMECIAVSLHQELLKNICACVNLFQSGGDPLYMPNPVLWMMDSYSCSSKSYMPILVKHFVPGTAKISLFRLLRTYGTFTGFVPILSEND